MAGGDTWHECQTYYRYAAKPHGMGLRKCPGKSTAAMVSPLVKN
ncbi:MAG: hypothetical protein U1D30_24540 [Planctomycetota bacterium]